MRCRVLRTCHKLLVVVELFAIITVGANALHAAALSGSYAVIHKTDAGPRMRVRLELRLINREPHELRIERLALWDLPHPGKDGSQPCAIVLRARSAADLEEDFNVSRSQFKLWRRGSVPRLLLELRAPNGSRTTEIVRLDRISRGKVD
jgi:hypothetical protein